MALRQIPDSPFIRGEFPNPLRGIHLSWLTDISSMLSGSSGSGPLVNQDGVKVGGYKAIGGIVHAWFSVGAGRNEISLPTVSNAGPCHLSDGSTIWPDADGKLTVNPSIDVKGWITYRG